MPLQSTSVGTGFGRCLLCGLAAAAMLGGPAGGQLLAQPQAVQQQRAIVQPGNLVVNGQAAGGAAANPNADANLNLTVPDSMEAAKDLETARAMERQKDWTKAAIWYQTVLDKYRSKVALVSDPSASGPRLYVSVVLQVRQRLHEWPAEGIAAYRAHYESTAAALLQQAAPDDLASLDQILGTYFLTLSAKTAGLRLVDAHLERGNFDSAAAYADLLLNSYPKEDLVQERPALLFRAALAFHLYGDNVQAQARLEQLKDKFSQAKGTLFGQTVNWVQALEAQMQIAPVLANRVLADSWPMLGGTPDHSAISQGGGRAGAREYVLDLTPVSADNDAAVQQAAARAARFGNTVADAGNSKGGPPVSVIPAVDQGQLFFQDGRRIWAVDLESGVPLPGWAQTYNNDSVTRGQYIAADTTFPRAGPCSVTLTPDVVVAVMGQNGRQRTVPWVMPGQQPPEAVLPKGNELVCLDRQTGRQRWAKPVIPASLPEENLKYLDFCDAPQVIGDSVFVLGYGGKDPQFDNCYLLCFDLADGHYKWSCFIAAASNAVSPFGGNFGMLTVGGPQPQMGCSGGRVYVLSNVGALACVDGYNGSIEWLTVYPQDQRAKSEAAAVAMNPWANQGRSNPTQALYVPWAENPVIVVDGRIFILPADGKSIDIYNVADGSLIKEIDATNDIFSPHLSDKTAHLTLLAVMGERLLFCDGHRIFCLDWKKFDAEHPEPSIVWASSGDYNVLQNGRAFVTVDSVFFPTKDALLRISQANARIIDRYPADQVKWDNDQKEGPGNLLVTGEHVIIASAESVSVYTDIAMARQKLDAEVAAAPSDPDPHLHYAEIMFAAGQTQVTLKKIDDAVALLGGIDAMRPCPSREKLYMDTLTWAVKLANEPVTSGARLADVFRMFDLAGRAAYDDSEQVNYRMTRAKIVRSAHDADNPLVGDVAAVVLYQQILSNPAWRKVVLTLGSGKGVVQASTRAEALINEIIAINKSAYADIEKQADQALADAQAAGPQQIAKKLLDVADTFPNSKDAYVALLQAAKQFENDGNAALATHVLRATYHKYSDRADASRVIEAMARNYLKLAQQGRSSAVGVAARRLAKAVEKSPDGKLDQPLILPSGQTLPAQTPVKQACDALALWEDQHPRQQPAADFHLPFKPTPAQIAAGQHRLRDSDCFATENCVAQDVTDILRSPVDTLIAQPTDRLVVQFLTNQLAIYAAGQAQALATTQPLDKPARGLIWLDGARRFIVWTSDQVAAVDAKSGAFLWRSQVGVLPAVEVVQVSGSADQLADAGASSEKSDDDNDFQVMAAGGNAQIMVMRARQRAFGGNMGAVQTAVKPENPGGPEQVMQLCATHDGVVIGSSNGRVAYLDGDTGKVRWQTQFTNYPVNRLLACDDFTVVELTNANNAIEFDTLDNYDGQLLSQRNKFVPNVPDSGLLPVNMVLSDDGLLAWTLPDRIQACDLYEPGNAVMDSTGGAESTNNARRPQVPSNPIYVGMVRPDQLCFSQNNILALCNDGHIVVHSLAELQSTLTHRGTALKTVPLGTGAQGTPQCNDSFIRTGGPWIYCVGPLNFWAYRLPIPSGDKKWTNWQGALEDPPQSNIHDAFVGKDYVVLLDIPAGTAKGAGQGAVPMNRLQILSRESVAGEPGSETGLNKCPLHISDSSGIEKWQGVEGGFYYLAGDHKLHFLRGLRPE